MTIAADDEVVGGVVVPGGGDGDGPVARIVTRDEWLLGASYGFSSTADAQRFTLALEREMIATKRFHIVMDARSHTGGSREASEVMWDWVGRCDRLRSMALVNNSDTLALAVRMKNLASPTKKVRPFKTVAEAEVWVRERVSD